MPFNGRVSIPSEVVLGNRTQHYPARIEEFIPNWEGLISNEDLVLESCHTGRRFVKGFLEIGIDRRHSRKWLACASRLAPRTLVPS